MPGQGSDCDTTPKHHGTSTNLPQTLGCRSGGDNGRDILQEKQSRLGRSLELRPTASIIQAAANPRTLGNDKTENQSAWKPSCGNFPYDSREN